MDCLTHPQEGDVLTVNGHSMMVYYANHGTVCVMKLESLRPFKKASHRYARMQFSIHDWSRKFQFAEITHMADYV